jgi:uncharacterized membrane protein YebE (DUF533 family)
MGKVLFLLVLLVAAVAGRGYWNYNRNAAIEADLHKPRPFANISTPDLMKLIAAYEAENKRAKARVAATPGSDAAISQKDESDIEGKADAFAAFQRQNEAWKAQRGNVMEHQVELEQLRFEKSIRDRHLDDPQEVFKRRLLTF